jgi:hypothetical protein
MTISRTQGDKFAVRRRLGPVFGIYFLLRALLFDLIIPLFPCYCSLYAEKANSSQ